MKRFSIWGNFLLMFAMCSTLLASASGKIRNPFDPLDQGGDSCADAVEILCIPFCDRGTTDLATDNFTPPCAPGDSPDVVYSFTPAATETLTVSTCGSAYFTALHIYQGCPPEGNLICCNVGNPDCVPPRACCEGVIFIAGVTYYIIVDGGLTEPDRGAYVLYVGHDYCQSFVCPPDECTLPSADDEETNNTCGDQVPSVCCDTSLCGEIESPTDVDWYRVRICDCSRLTINVFGNDTPDEFPFCRGLNPQVHVYGSDCTTLAGVDLNGGVGNDARLQLECVQPNLYYIRVAAQAGQYGPYILSIQCTQDNCCDDCIDCISAYQSPEACDNFPDNFDGGCGFGRGFNPHVLSTYPGHQDSVCGSIRLGIPGTPADQDWYEVEPIDTAGPNVRITWCATSSVPFSIGIVEKGYPTPCNGTTLLECATGDSCDTLCISICVPGSNSGYLCYIKGQRDICDCCGDYVAHFEAEEGCLIFQPLPPGDVVIHFDPPTFPGTVLLNWVPSPSVTGYNVYRSEILDSLNLPGSLIGTATASQFVDSTGVQNSPPYVVQYYSVVAVRSPASECSGD